MRRPHEVLLSLGSNIEPARWVPRGLELLAARFDLVAVSPRFDVGAVGDPSQPRFVNLAVRLRTDLRGPALRMVCKHIEVLCGRARGADPFAPRTLDVDVVYTAVSDGEVHDDLLGEAYVLVPCALIWPDAVVEGYTLAEEAEARFPGWGESRRMEDA